MANAREHQDHWGSLNTPGGSSITPGGSITISLNTPGGSCITPGGSISTPDGRIVVSAPLVIFYRAKWVNKP